MLLLCFIWGNRDRTASYLTALSQIPDVRFSRTGLLGIARFVQKRRLIPVTCLSPILYPISGTDSIHTASDHFYLSNDRWTIGLQRTFAVFSSESPTNTYDFSKNGCCEKSKWTSYETMTVKLLPYPPVFPPAAIFCAERRKSPAAKSRATKEQRFLPSE
ncbi:MAG: hypothetical protein JJV98_19870 [Desulfosarcina sp.]|nr:hypothetical protein [Desulfobacterales bacterium]